MRSGRFSSGKAGIAPAVLCLAAGTALWTVTAPAASLALSSGAFSDGDAIPARYTCDGAGLSPPLAWSGVPAGTRSLVLIMDDPDAPDPAAPKMTWVHWLVYNLPPESAGLPEDADHAGLPPGTREGLNDFRRTAYGGPCPPVGRHRYFIKLYALDSVLPGLDTPDKEQLLGAMQDHVLEQTRLMGTYSH